MQVSSGWNIIDGRPLLVHQSTELNERTTVYRYCSFAECLQIARGRWSFADPHLWPDKVEGRVIQMANSPRFQQEIARSVRASCFSREHTSEAMWRLYCGSDLGLRIKVKLRELLLNLSDAIQDDQGPAMIAAWSMKYVKSSAIAAEMRELSLHESDEKSGTKRLDLLRLKRDGFKHERETRVAVLSYSPLGTETWRTFAADGPSVLCVDGISANCIAEVLLDPYMEAWKATELMAVLSTLLPSSVRISQSRFDAPVPRFR